jgi:hypothetical protein
MKITCWIAGAVFLSLPGVLNAQDAIFRTELPLKAARSRDPVLGGARDKIFVQVWIPDGVKVVRGGICNPFSRDEGPGKHWQAVARQWKFALVAVDFDAVRKDEFPLLAEGLAELAKKSGHPELAHMPLCFTGMSRGGGMSMQLAELMPERTLACVPVCLEVGPGSDATRQVPVVTIFGEKDGMQMPLLFKKLAVEREKQARFGIAVQWGRGHEFALANNLSFVFLDDVLRDRLPEMPEAEKSALRSIPLEKGWLGEIKDWKKGEASIASASEFKGDVSKTCWFPTKRTAAVWRAFVSPHGKQIKITEPPGLGDKQPFIPHSADKAISVRIAAEGINKGVVVELWDADVKLAERKEGPWNFEVMLKPGIHSLIAAVRSESGELLSRPHTIVVNER